MSQCTIKHLLNRESCEQCSKYIYVGQPTVICKKCEVIQHGKCSTTNFTHLRNNWYCNNCIIKHDIHRYNPFFDIIENSEYEEVYGNEPVDFIESYEHISNLLEQCKNYSRFEFNHYLNLHNINSTNSFSNYFLNIDGNNSNFDNFVTELQLLDVKFSVIGLAETNTDASNKDVFQIDGYTSCYQNTFPNKKKGTGVALYINNNFNFTIENEYSLCNKDIETLFIKITNCPKPITVGVIYRPPSGNLKAFNTELQKIISELPSENVYIMGDYNINLHNLKNEIEREYEEMVISSGYVPIVSIATHEKPHCQPSCIDNILANKLDDIEITGTISSLISHHRPIFQFSKLNFGSSKTNSEIDFKIYYDYSRKNLENFGHLLAENLSTFNVQNELFRVDHEFSEFADIFQNSVDYTCKLDTPITSKRNRIHNPWITPDLVNSINKKEKLYRAWKKSVTSKNKSGNLQLYNEYKSHRKNLTKLIKHAKKTYYGNEFEKCTGNPKKTWSLINDLRGKSTGSLKPSFLINNERVVCRRIIASKFNTYFASLATTMNAEAAQHYYFDEQNSFEDYMSKSCESSFFLEDCDSTEIMEIIQELSADKASDIPILLIKSTSQIIAPYLSKLYNKSMETGEFPEIFKVGKITPIYKKGNRDLIENYRPVSTLPIFGKIFEKIIHKRLYSFLLSKNTIPKTQFGFRKGHSTSHAVNYSVNVIKEAHRLKKHVIGIFIDLSKAFDTIDHQILLDKLENAGVRGTPLSLFSSYLSKRRQYTSVGNSNSDFENVIFGVPQGSVLGPLLFLLYVSDMLNCYKNTGCEFVLYADDTNLFVIDINRESAIQKANLILENINKYMQSNLLHINLTKCCYIHFDPKTRKNKNNDLENSESSEIKIGNHIIKEVSEAKFLGVTIDKKLTWIPHIENIRKKLTSANGIIRRIRHFIPKKQFKSIYFSLFESHITYCISVWGGVGKVHIDKLFRLQKQCIRMLFGDQNMFMSKFSAQTTDEILDSDFYGREHTKPLFKENNILIIHNLYRYHTAFELFKIMKTRRPISVFEQFNVSQRNNGNLIILGSYSNQFFFLGAKIWNTVVKHIIPNSDILSVKFGSFKNKLKSLLFNNQNMFDSVTWVPQNFLLQD